MVGATQAEPRTERATISLTKTEKESLRLVSTVDRIDESNLLRERPLSEVLIRADEIRAKLAEGLS